MNPANSCVLPTTLPAEEPGDGRIAQALQEYEAALKSGRRPDRQAFLQQHPEAAERIADYLDGLDFLHAAAVQLDAPTPQAPSSAQSASGLGELGDFRLMREVGRGGMGVVYEAEQISLGRRVALKVLPFAATMDARQLQRFHNEARAAASLHHPHIVPVHAVGVERGVHFYAMQFIEGQSLEALVREVRNSGVGALHTPTLPGKLQNKLNAEVLSSRAPDTRDGPADTVGELRDRKDSPPVWHPDDLRRVAVWMVQAAEALEHAHSVGIVHRDVKPANLLLDQRGELWVTDFGLARTGLAPGLTMTGDLLGTLRYMSPEQALARHGLVDHRTDVYSLGTTLFELLTLQPAIDGQDRQEILNRIANEEPRPPCSLNHAISSDLETVVLKAMAKEPSERYATAQELADDLRRFLKDEPIRARRPTLWQRARKWARRHPSVVAAAVIVLALVVMGSALGAWLVWKEQRETRTALQRELEAKYRYQIALAERYWLANQVPQAQRVLLDCDPKLRNWEWHYLRRLFEGGLLSLPGHSRRVVSVTFSSDGKRIASLSRNPDVAPRGIDGKVGVPSQVKVWDAVTGQQVSTRDVSPADAVGFSADGTLLTLSIENIDVVVRDAATGQEVHRLRGHAGKVVCVAFSPDGKSAASFGMDQAVKVWDLSNGKVRHTLHGHMCTVGCFAFTPDGRFLASASCTGRWDPVDPVSPGPDGKLVGSAPRTPGPPLPGGEVKVWDLATGKQEFSLGSRPSHYTAVAFSTDGEELATASGDGTIRIWDARTGQEVRSLGSHGGPVYTLAWTPAAQRFAFAVELDLGRKMFMEGHRMRH